MLQKIQLNSFQFYLCSTKSQPVAHQSTLKLQSNSSQFYVIPH